MREAGNGAPNTAGLVLLPWMQAGHLYSGLFWAGSSIPGQPPHKDWRPCIHDEIIQRFCRSTFYTIGDHTELGLSCTLLDGEASPLHCGLSSPSYTACQQCAVRPQCDRVNFVTNHRSCLVGMDGPGLSLVSACWWSQHVPEFCLSCSPETHTCSQVNCWVHLVLNWLHHQCTVFHSNTFVTLLYNIHCYFFWFLSVFQTHQTRRDHEQSSQCGLFPAIGSLPDKRPFSG